MAPKWQSDTAAAAAPADFPRAQRSLGSSGGATMRELRAAISGEEGASGFCDELLLIEDEVAEAEAEAEAEAAASPEACEGPPAASATADGSLMAGEEERRPVWELSLLASHAGGHSAQGQGEVSECGDAAHSAAASEPNAAADACGCISMKVAACAADSQNFVWDACECARGPQAHASSSAFTTDTGDGSGEPSLCSEDASVADAGVGTAASDSGGEAGRPAGGSPLQPSTECQGQPEAAPAAPAERPWLDVGLPPGLEVRLAYGARHPALDPPAGLGLPPPGLESGGPACTEEGGCEAAPALAMAAVAPPWAAAAEPRGLPQDLDLDALSTEDLIGLLFDESLRTELERRGVPLRRHLLRCLRLVQSAAGPAASPSQPGPACTESQAGNVLRADAPVFTPSAPELALPPAALPGPSCAAASLQEQPHDALLQGLLELPQEALLHALLGCLPPPGAPGPPETSAELPESAGVPQALWEHHCLMHAKAVASAQWHASHLQGPCELRAPDG
mmetsp:Transcript_95511/g.308257  ORF Transcript_95511/g.308257 Transcript_95511/m.308257 type:complete len:510 (-) Transcript_95511:49-1578(-)